MKMKAFFLALAVAGAAASFGLTATGRSDVGTTTDATTTTVATTTTAPTTTTTSTDGCRRFELQGSLTAVAATSFSVKVTKGNKAVKDASGTTVPVAVGPDTRVTWQGRGTLTGPNVGDTAKVNGKQCGTTLTASSVQARGPKKASSSADKAKGDSTESATTTSSSAGSHGKKHK
jgi:hypothetical protein